MVSSSLPSRNPAGRNKRRRGREQSFVQYLSFGLCSTTIVGCFCLAYALVMVCLLPILKIQPSTSSGTASHPFEGAYIPHAPGQERFAEAASALRSRWQRMRKGHGVTDESLLNVAKAEFEVLRSKKRDVSALKVSEENAAPDALSTKKAGFVVLGMHRSGTSMLSGLLTTGMGYNVGGPLIGAHFDNEKGFFERIDVVLQNDEFMDKQRIWWSAGVLNFDSEQAMEHKKSGLVTFKEGAKGLRFLNDPANAPWLQKDPRMCITLPVWLKLLNAEPAVVFTYRHPLEVAMSLKTREKNFTLEHGLRLWIVYNMRAVQNSEGLCRVLSSNDVILDDPLKEVQRISDELTDRCGVPSPPTRIEKEHVDQFVDPKLQHNKKKRQETDKEKRVLADYSGCIAHDFESDYSEGSASRTNEVIMYKQAMKIYCDFLSGDAYKPSYEWPSLQ